MKRKYKYDEKNPLLMFYEDLVKNNKKIRVNNWRILSELTNMPVQTVISISRLDYNGVLRMNLGTYKKLKETINVDMLSFGKGDDQSN